MADRKYVGPEALSRFKDNMMGMIGSKVIVHITDDESLAVGGTLSIITKTKTYTRIITGTGDYIFNGIGDIGTVYIDIVHETNEIYLNKPISIPYYGVYESVIYVNQNMFKYQEWLILAGLNVDSYNDLEAVLEDEKAVRILMTKTDSVDYLVTCLPDNIDVADVILNDLYVAKWINYREYAYSSLYAVPDLKTIMNSTGKYGMYITVEKSKDYWQPKGLVPVMTSNTAPYGKVSASTQIPSGADAFRAFDGENANTYWCTETKATISGSWLKYEFDNPTNVKRFKLINRNTQNVETKSIKSFKLQASNGDDWVDLGEYVNESAAANYETWYDVINDKYYKQYRIYVSGGYSTENVTVGLLQFYGRQLEGLVPPMTSSSSVIGEVSVDSSNDTGDYKAVNVFDNKQSTRWISMKNTDAWIQYKFAKPTKVSRVMIRPDYFNNTSPRVKNFKIQASNDGILFNDIYTGIIDNSLSSNTEQHFEFINDVAYKYYRIYIIDSYYSTYAVAINTAQFYGTPDYESRTYIYDHGVEVMDVSAGKCLSTYGMETKESDHLLLTTTATSVPNGNIVPQFYVNSMVDLSEYSLVNLKTDNVLDVGTLTRYGMLGIVSPVPYKSGINAMGGLNINKHDNNVIDISTINDISGLVVFGNAGSTILTVSEWWLE